MYDNEYVTIIVCAKEAQGSLRSCLDSLLDQTRRPDCIMVACLQSEDGTWPTMGEWLAGKGHPNIPWMSVPELNHDVDDVRVQAIHLPNVSPGAARNRCMTIRCGETTIFGFIEACNQYFPEKIARSLEVFGRSEAISCVVSDFLVERGASRFREYLPAYHNVRSLAGPIYGSSILVRKEYIHKAGPLDESLPVFIEHEWMTRLSEHGVVYHVPEALHLAATRPPMEHGQRFLMAIANRAVERRGGAG